MGPAPVSRLLAALGLALAAWASPAGAGLFSAVGPVIAVLEEELFLGEAEGHLDGSGTLTIHSRDRPAFSCRGQFTSSAALGGDGELHCSDGSSAMFKFQRLSFRTGYGTGGFARGPMTFTYGLTAEESRPYLTFPTRKSIPGPIKE